ncbi:hypothetical protein QYM46_15975 [Brevibacterium sp. K11IcPPYGO002]|uniref:hypothetical protein n=1 Tax=Brevibacterium sp. K11IcPPYGO002 TaxID=3058837 RepID=UPI003D819295
MRVLFQGAGAVGLAGAALFTDAHEVAVVSRSPGADGRAAFPRRVSIADPTDSGQVGSRRSSCSGGRGRADGGRASSSDGWSVTRVAATRRVTITDWIAAAADGIWDLIVLTTRPGDLDAEVVAAIRDISPAFIATTSQVEGDLERAQAVFPGAQAVIVGPAFLSERLDPGVPADVMRPADSGVRPAGNRVGEADRRVRPADSRAGEVDRGVSTDGGRDGRGSRRAEPGHEVRFWAPAGAPRFLVAGPRGAVRSLVRGLGRLVLPVPMEAVVLPPTVFIPFVAELSIRDGDWAALKSHLGRPADAATEAVRSRLGVPAAVFGTAAHVVLAALERIVPIDVTNYAGRHFNRHVGQTRDMLAGWAGSADSAHALQELIAALDANGT